MAVDESVMPSAEKLKDEIEELKEMVKECGGETAEEAMHSLSKLHRHLLDRTDKMMHMYAPILEKYRDSGKEMVREVEARVAEKPLTSLLFAFGAGVLIGKLCRRHVRQ